MSTYAEDLHRCKVVLLLREGDQQRRRQADRIGQGRG
jgi:hypothetical protein